MILAVLMYAILASTFTIAKAVLSYAKPFFIIGFRMTLAGIIFLVVQYFSNRTNFRIHRKDIWLFFRVALFNIYFAFIPEFWALQYVHSSKVVLLYSLTPFIVAGFAYFLVKEKVTFQKIIGMAIGFCGMIPILMTQNDIREAAMEMMNISIPEFVLLFAITSAAYAWFPIKKLMDRGYTVPFIHGSTMFCGGILALVTSLVFEGYSTSPIYNFGPFLGLTLLLVVISNGIFYNMYGFLLKRYAFTVLSFAGCTTPIFGAFYGWFFLSEPITWHYGVSFVCVSIGLYLFYRNELSSCACSAASIESKK
jgi:drug/metabolite transporter (DMT)-like permease